MKNIIVTVCLLLLVELNLVSCFPETRVIGGANAKRGKFPFIVSLKRLKTFGHFCGGTIIDKNWVLTAAHCVYQDKAKDLYLLAGTNSINEIGVTVTRVPIDQIIVHKNFKYPKTAYDIALLKVATPFDFSTKKIQKADLPNDLIDGNVNVTALGWGISDMTNPMPSYTLQWLETSTLSYENCLEKVDKTTKDELCVFDKETTGVCGGDSGSPLVISGTNKVVGVASWVKWCAQGYPDMYTRVSSYIDWIEENIKNNK